MNAAKLSICFPVFRDFDGLYFSAMDIPLTHAEILDDVEIVVVDNEPNTPIGQTTKAWVEGHLAANVRARYVAFPGPGGPAGTKQKCVDEASGKYVLVMDSHVRVAKGGIARLLAYYDAHPETIDFLSGPMLYDSNATICGKGETLTGYATHMDEVWRGESLGIWASDPRGATIDGEPFVVPAMGCGLFSCRKEAFVGFNRKRPSWAGAEDAVIAPTRGMRSCRTGICVAKG